MSKTTDFSPMDQVQVKARALEFALQIRDFYKRYDLSRTAQDGSGKVLKPESPDFLFSTAREVEDYLQGNFTPSYFSPK